MATAALAGIQVGFMPAIPCRNRLLLVARLGHECELTAHR